MTQTPVCVRRTSTVEEADLAAAWLEDAGVKATVLGRDSVGLQAFGVTDEEGVSIFVPDEETARRARILLAEHDLQFAERLRTTNAQAPVKVVCEECGTANSFTPGLCGTVQECSRCGANLDVPGIEEVTSP